MPPPIGYCPAVGFGGRHERSDAELLAAHVAGDRYAFDQLFRRHHRQLRSARPNSSPGAAHAARPHVHPVRMIAGAAGLCAVATAIGVGAVVDAPPPAPSAPTTAQHITVSKPAPVIPLSRPQVLDLLHHTPDYGPPGGPLGHPSRRTSCLSGLGYPASTPVLGAQPIDIDAWPAVLLVIPADTPDKLAVFAVAPHCSAADTGLLASTVVPRA